MIIVVYRLGCIAIVTSCSDPEVYLLITLNALIQKLCYIYKQAKDVIIKNNSLYKKNLSYDIQER